MGQIITKSSFRILQEYQQLSGISFRSCGISVVFGKVWMWMWGEFQKILNQRVMVRIGTFWNRKGFDREKGAVGSTSIFVKNAFGVKTFHIVKINHF